MLWDTEGLLVVKYGFHAYGFEARSGVLRWSHRSASPILAVLGLVAPRPRHRPGRGRDVRDRGRRRGRLAGRALRRRDGRRAGRRAAGADELRRPGPRARSAHGARARAEAPTGGRMVDNIRPIGRSGVDKSVDRGPPRRIAWKAARRGRAMLTAAITSTPTRRVGSFGLLISRRTAARSRTAAASAPAAIIAPVIPILLVLAGLALLGIGWILLRSLGAAARVGRILAATPVVPVARALALADGGASRATSRSPAGSTPRRSSRTSTIGPLVYRRTRLETRSRQGLDGDRGRAPGGAVRARRGPRPDRGRRRRRSTRAWSSSRASRRASPRTFPTACPRAPRRPRPSGCGSSS